MAAAPNVSPFMWSVIVALLFFSGFPESGIFANGNKFGREQDFRSSPDGAGGHSKCEKITVPMCKNMEYNETIMPNLLNHMKQGVAGLEVAQYIPLVKVGCSSKLSLFLCTLYVPVCTIMGQAIPPCRGLCEEARNTGCEALMNKFGFKWPDTLRCDQFPVEDRGEVCVIKSQTQEGRPTKRPIGNFNPGQDITGGGQFDLQPNPDTRYYNPGLNKDAYGMYDLTHTYRPYMI